MLIDRNIELHERLDCQEEASVGRELEHHVKLTQLEAEVADLEAENEDLLNQLERQARDFVELEAVRAEEIVMLLTEVEHEQVNHSTRPFSFQFLTMSTDCTRNSHPSRSGTV